MVENLSSVISQGHAASGLLFASPSTLINGTIAAVADAGALTISLRTPNDEDPSSAKPLRLPFLKTTTAPAVTEVITSATSITIPSGATLGTPVGYRFKIWLVAIKADGGIKLGVINCRSEVFSGLVDLRTYILNDAQTLDVPTAIGTGSDSAGIIYSSSGIFVGTGQCRILGYLSWSNGNSATPGTWVDPDEIQLAGPDIHMPGQEVQRASFNTYAVSTITFGATDPKSLPYDTTNPQADEYEEFARVPFTATHPAHIIEVTFSASLSAPSATEKFALVISSTVGAVGAAGPMVIEKSDGIDIPKRLVLVCAGLASTEYLNYIFGIAYTGAGVVTVNGAAGAALFTSNICAHMSVTEYAT